MRTLLAQMLTNRSHTFVACENAEQAMEHYRHTFYPLVLLDLFLPEMSGFEFCRWLRQQPDGDRPFVLIGTASKDTADLQKILEAGADDYLIKPFALDLLDVRLAIADRSLKLRAIRKQLEEDLRQEREQLTYLATRDHLTKLYNRAYFFAAIETAVENLPLDTPPGALLYLDLDHFKLVNFSLGYAAGNRLLVQIAYLLRNAIGPHDTLAHFEGDKFAILLERITLSEARLVAERIRTGVSNLIFHDSSRRFNCSVSIGIAPLIEDTSAEQLQGMADAACYTAKAHGRNRVEVSQESEFEMVQLRLDSACSDQVKETLRRDALELQLQPVVCMESYCAKFHDALLCLRTPVGESIEPWQYLPAARRFGLLPELDRALVQLAVRQLAADPGLHLSLHPSDQALEEGTLPDFIRRAFSAARIASDRVTWVWSEAAVSAKFDAARTMMESLQRHGFRFALDGFGASTLVPALLKVLPLSYLGINGGFMRGLPGEPINLALVKTLNDITHHLGIPSLCESVETEAAFKLLQGVGVDYARGNYFARSGEVQLDLQYACC